MNPPDPKDDPVYINTGAFNVTKGGSIAAGVLTVLSAVPVFLKALNPEDLPTGMVYGAFALAGLCVIAVTILIRTDLQVRGAAKVSVVENLYSPSDAEEGDESGPEEDEEASEEDEVAYVAPAATVPIAVPFSIKLHDGDGRHLVLAVGWNPKTGAPAYLAGKPDELPRWIDEEEVQIASYGGNGAPPIRKGTKSGER